MLYPGPRTYWSKFVEALSALKMTSQLSKDEILELYMNLIPMGRNVRGVGSASLAFFDKPIDAVSTQEACVLAALPRAPSRLDPRRSSGARALLRERNYVIGRLEADGMITPDESAAMKETRMSFSGSSLKFEAPHFSDYLRARGRLRPPSAPSTLDLDIQRTLAAVLRAHRTRLAALGATQAAAVALDVRKASVVAMVGSLKYDPLHDGFNNGALARRSAGSTLKPFLYALLIEKSQGELVTIADTDVTHRTPVGDYSPLNADRRAYGPVTIRSALGNSLNLSAVRVLKQLGVREFYEFLKRLDLIEPNAPNAEELGLGLAVGNLDVSLLGLVQAYATLARGGMHRRTAVIKGEAHESARVMSEQCAYIISDILADPAARLLTFGNPGYFDFGFPVSVKTGTSSNYRDAWAVAYTPNHVVGVWAGNFDGRPAHRAMGAGACGPIIKDIMTTLYAEGPPPRFKRPKGVYEGRVCWISGKIASSNCPYTAQELLPSPPETLPRCDAAHGDYHHARVGGAYAQWVHTREMQHGQSRFRLLTPEAVAPFLAREVSGGDFRSSARRHSVPVSIISPHDGDRIAGGPFGARLLRFQAVVDPPRPFVSWVIDGIEAARTAPPYDFHWSPVRGTHEVIAVTPENQASKIVIEVE
jgi:penicillin-binding protein 1C